MITQEIQTKIVEGVAQQRKNYNSDAKHAVALGMSASQYTNIKKGTDKQLSEARWIALARRVGVSLTNSRPWVTVATPTYEYISNQLQACQERSISAIFCDLAGIGKSHTAKVYCSKNANAIYVDCSQVKSKQKLIRKIAREFGIDHTSRYGDVYEDLCFYLQTIATPIVILDEAGDLDYSAFLELKALWNATEYQCGWYMMGADGLEEKIKRLKDQKKVGYTELFDRYGNGFKRITPHGKEALQEFNLQQIALVSKANNSQAPINQLFAKTGGSLRKLRIEIEKEQILETL